MQHQHEKYGFTTAMTLPVEICNPDMALALGGATLKGDTTPILALRKELKIKPLVRAISAAFSAESQTPLVLEEAEVNATSPSKVGYLPRQLLDELSREVGKGWRLVDQARVGKHVSKEDCWPDWCFLTSENWYGIASAVSGVPVGSPELDGWVQCLSAFGTWRVTQGIYTFPPELEAALIDSTIEGQIPADEFMKLPEWCCYVESKSGALRLDDKVYEGFFAHLGYDRFSGGTALHLLFCTANTFSAVPLHLTGCDIEQALAQLHTTELNPHTGQHETAEFSGEMLNSVRHLVEPALSMLLYICSEAGDRGDPALRPNHPEPRATKKGPRFFPPDRPVVWNVGTRMGAALRTLASRVGVVALGGTHASPRPHIRRGHWHSYRVGPGRQNVKVVWIRPIAVNLKDVSELAAVIRPVGGQAADVQEPSWHPDEAA